jgi:hypothetical protein
MHVQIVNGKTTGEHTLEDHEKFMVLRTTSNTILFLVFVEVFVFKYSIKKLKKSCDYISRPEWTEYRRYLSPSLRP